MSLAHAYRLGLALTLVLGQLAVLLGGEMPGGSWVALAAVPLAELARARRRVLLSAVPATLLALSGLVLGVSTILRRGVGGVILGGVIALLVILVARVVSANSLRHDLQALVISLLLLFGGAAINGRLAYGAVFLAYAVTAVWALVTRQLVRGATSRAEREDDAAGLAATLARRDIVTGTFAAVTAALALCILLSTSLLFVLFPRLGFRNLGLFAVQGSRFPADVSLAGDPRAAGGAGVLARVSGVRYRDFDAGLYLRGPIYDSFAGRGFVQTGAPETLPAHLLRPAAVTPILTYEVFVQPVMGDLVPSLGPVQRAHVLAGGQGNPSLRTYLVGQGPQGELRAWSALTGPARYAVTGAIQQPLGQERAAVLAVPNETHLRQVLAHYRGLPDGLDPRIPALARRVLDEAGVAHGTFHERAGALRAFLNRDYRYTLANPNGGAADPLAAFLFDDQRGHCEYFATAYGALLRAAGVPSRVVGGLHGGAWAGEPDDPQAVIVFTSADAHAWVEWLDPEHGWLLDDPTPAGGAPRTLLTGFAVLIERLRRAWDDSVVDYSADDQIALLSSAAAAARSPWERLQQVLPQRAALRSALGAGLLAALGLALLLALRRASRRRPGHARLAAALVRFIERRTGEPPPPSATLREGIGHALATAPAVRGKSHVELALAAYEADRFGGRPIAPRQALELARALDAAGGSPSQEHRLPE